MFTLSFVKDMETLWTSEHTNLEEATTALAKQHEWVAAAGAQFQKEGEYDFRAKALGSTYIAHINAF